MNNINENKFYIYAHVRPDTNEVFYIGKGCNWRAYEKTNRNKYWKNIVSKNAGDFKVILLAENICEDLAFELEIATIKNFREIGVNLCNMTDGGEGMSGLKFSDDHRKKISETQSGEKNNMYGRTGEKCPSYGRNGQKNPRSKPVIQISKITGEIVNTFSCGREAMRQTEINHSHISLCCNGKRKSAGEYIWKYVDILSEITNKNSQTTNNRITI